MEETLHQLDINEKEARFYLGMLELKPMTASNIAKAFNESRTNTYMILEELSVKGLIAEDDSQKVRHYYAAPPEKLTEILQTKQKELQSTQNSLSEVMQELQSMYILGQHKPGVSYLEGLNGYKKMLEDCTRSSTDILTFGATNVPKEQGYNDILLRGLAKRKARGIKTRMLLDESCAPHVDTKHYLEVRGQDVRFWGKAPYESEIVIYENKVVLTVYEPNLINVIITNSIIAGTFKAIFNQIWDITD